MCSAHLEGEAVAEAQRPGRESPNLSEQRNVVLEYLQGNPGAYIADVALHLGCSHTTASYHLAGLARQGLVHRRKEGRVVRHYLTGMDTDPARLASFMADARRRAIVRNLLASPMWPLNQLATAVGVNHAFLMRSVSALADMGFAELVRPRARYYAKATPRLARALPLAMQPERPMVMLATEDFVPIAAEIVFP